MTPRHNSTNADATMATGVRARAIAMHRMVSLLALSSMLAVGCTGGPSTEGANEVVVYTAHDSVYSEPIFSSFQAATGVTVRAKFDVESTKTVGLVNEIIAESARPRCDVFWNNEILNTLRLQQRGLLQAYVSPAAKNYPAPFKDAQGRWHGFAARARIVICNTNLVPADQRPDSIYDLADAKWKGRTALAKPLFGTTASHAACLFAALGDDAAKAYFRSLKDNGVQILAGNKQVAVAVANGEAAFALTDTDDALEMIADGHPVSIIYPDQQPEGLGTLFIPNTLCIIKGGPHPAAARKLVDFLLSPKVEAALARGPSGQIPLNPKVNVKTKVEGPPAIRPMNVDFAAAAAGWETTASFIAEEFAGP